MAAHYRFSAKWICFAGVVYEVADVGGEECGGCRNGRIYVVLLFHLDNIPEYE